MLGIAALGMIAGALVRISTGEKILNDRINEAEKKTSEVEIWVRDNLVRRDEFTSSVAQINRSLDGLRAYVESTAKTTDEKLERMRLSIDGKLDKIIGNRPLDR